MGSEPILFSNHRSKENELVHFVLPSDNIGKSAENLQSNFDYVI